MTTNRTIAVSEWSESQSPVIAERQSSRWFWPPSIIGLVGTLVLHCLVLQTVLVVNRAPRIPRAEGPEPGSSQNKLDAKPAERLVFIDLSKTASANNEIDQSLAYLRAAIRNTPIAVIPPDPSPSFDIETLALEEEKPSGPSVDSGEGADGAHLIGIYTGQIRARVERIWRRPRSPVNEHASLKKAANSDESFQCQVQIVQDMDRNVQEVLLPRCNGSPAWRRSLVFAIQQASPLPAPPSSSVFSHSIALNFVGLPYAAGAPEEDYEILAIKPGPSSPTLPTSRTTQVISGPPSSAPSSSPAADPSLDPNNKLTGRNDSLYVRPQ